jgi:hypothetical protein
MADALRDAVQRTLSAAVRPGRAGTSRLGGDRAAQLLDEVTSLGLRASVELARRGQGAGTDLARRGQGAGAGLARRGQEAAGEVARRLSAFGDRPRRKAEG